MRRLNILVMSVLVVSGCSQNPDVYQVPSPVNTETTTDPVSDQLGEEASKQAESECQKPLQPIVTGLHLLEPQNDKALEIQGIAALVVNGRAIVNSTSARAVRLNAIAYAKADPFYIVGGVERTGLGNIQGRLPGTNLAPIADPLSVLPAPSLDALPVVSDAHLDIEGAAVSLQPGIYQGGIHLSSRARVKMAPGIYFIQNGGLKVEGGSELISNDALIYISPKRQSRLRRASGGNDSRCSKSGRDDSEESAVKVVGGSLLKLSAPKGGGYKGVALFLDRAVPSKIEIEGIAGMRVNGMIYAPSSSVKVAGAAALDLRSSQLIARQMDVAAIGLITISGNVEVPVSGCLK